MHVTVTSCMRNASHYVWRYFYQMSGLQALLEARGDKLLVLVGEGDSRDDTRRRLFDCFASSRLDGKAIDTTHGGPSFGSVINKLRFAQMAESYNRVWAHIPDDTDVVLFVEGDLMWNPIDMVKLVDRLMFYPAVAPMVFHAPGCTLYGDPNARWWFDTWAYRKNGEHFTNEPPYYPGLNGEPMRLDTAGSCVAMRGVKALAVDFPAEDMVVGMTRQLGGVWLMPDLECEHPN